MPPTDAFGNTITDALTKGANDAAEATQLKSEGFWTSFSGMRYEPKMQYRFKVIVEGFSLEDAAGTSGDGAAGDFANDLRAPGKDLAWYAKSVDKPTVNIVSLGGKEFNFSANVTTMIPQVEKLEFKPITMTLVDPTYPNVTRKLLRWLRRSGYNDKQMQKRKHDGRSVTNTSWMKQNTFYNSVGSVQIIQLDHDGAPLERWILWNAFPVEINFGKLDYSNDGLVEISITWAYETFKCEMANIPRGLETEQNFTYFKDPVTPDKTLIRSPGQMCKARWNQYNENGEADKGMWKDGLKADDLCKNLDF